MFFSEHVKGVQELLCVYNCYTHVGAYVLDLGTRQLLHKMQGYMTLHGLNFRIGFEVRLLEKNCGIIMLVYNLALLRNIGILCAFVC